MTSFNRFAGFSDNGGMSIEKARVPGKKKPKSRLDDGYEGVDEEGFIPNSKRDPFHAIIEKQARARQAVTGESFAKAFTECYVAPENAHIRDLARWEHIARGEDAICGTALATPIKKARAPEDAKQDDVQSTLDNRGPAHTKLHQMAIEHSQRHGLTYAQSCSRLYTAPENAQLKAGIVAESGIRTLSLDEAMALSPAPPFPDYGRPGDTDYRNPNMGRSGAKPSGYAGG